MSSKNQYQEVMAGAFADELQKIARQKIAMSPETAKALGLVGAGAVGWGALTRANNDRRLGRQVRLQQQQGY